MIKENAARIITVLPKKNILTITKIKMKMYKNYRRGESLLSFSIENNNKQEQA